jgi:hypothetical protein
MPEKKKGKIYTDVALDEKLGKGNWKRIEEDALDEELFEDEEDEMQNSQDDEEGE